MDQSNWLRKVEDIHDICSTACCYVQNNYFLRPLSYDSWVGGSTGELNKAAVGKKIRNFLQKFWSAIKLFQSQKNYSQVWGF